MNESGPAPPPVEPAQVIAEAIQAEKEAEWFYTMAAEMISEDDVRSTLLDLARDEGSHARTLTNLHFEMTGHGVLDPPDARPEGDPNLFDFSTASRRDVLEFALKREHNAIALYQGQVDAAPAAKTAGVFQYLADAEREHAAYIGLLLGRLDAGEEPPPHPGQDC
ncbi:MAG TPA: ferritin family protein [Methylomirabilota bacterium]|nr:ferritin family protein [Methylomirabilota bacterium]